MMLVSRACKTPQNGCNRFAGPLASKRVECYPTR